MIGRPDAAPVLNNELRANDLTYQVAGLHSPTEVERHLVDDRTAVALVDIIRCTTTASAVIGAGAERLMIKVKRDDDDLTDLIELHRALGTGAELVIGGEKHGRPIRGGAFGNSCLEVPTDLSEKDVVFCSTNAGRALEAVTSAMSPQSPAGVFLASMANLPLLAELITREGYTRVVIASGGFYSRLSLEDAVAGGRLIRLLGLGDGALDDGAISMLALADRFVDDDELISVLQTNRIGRALVRYGRRADIPAAITGEGVPAGLWSAMTASIGRLTWIGTTPVFTNSDTNPDPNPNPKEQP